MQGLNVECPLFQPDFNRNWNGQKLLVTFPNIKLQEIAFSDSRVVSYASTDEQSHSNKHFHWNANATQIEVTYLRGYFFCKGILHS
jgi:hypothetical protein